jgi:hypothetical protein
MAIALALAALALPSAAGAKGAADPEDQRSISLGQVSTRVDPGDPWTATVIIRNGHGLPVAGPAPGLTLVGPSGERHEAVGSPTEQLGVYRVEFDRLAGATYRIEADDGHGGSFILDTVPIPDVAAGAPAGGEDGGVVVAAPVVAGALLGLVLLVARRRRRGGAESPSAA